MKFVVSTIKPLFISAIILTILTIFLRCPENSIHPKFTRDRLHIVEDENHILLGNTGLEEIIETKNKENLISNRKTDYSLQLPQVYPNNEQNIYKCDGIGLKQACGMNANGCKGYPQLFKSKDVMDNWKPDDPDFPTSYYNSICRFNYSNHNEREIALIYRNKGVPFVVYDVPSLDAASLKWTDDYIKEKLSNNLMKVEISKSNHFMYYRGEKEFAPYQEVEWNYEEFLRKSKYNPSPKTNDTHMYFFVNQFDTSNQFSWIKDDLEMFNYERKDEGGEFFVTQPTQQKGIHCRFGMRGIVAEGHYDVGLNMVAMIRGNKRYILAPPSTCKYQYLLSNGPSSRHTRVDWSNINITEFPLAPDSPVTEINLAPGDILYIPSYWYHHIVSLDHSIQCNTRSGIDRRLPFKYLKECGF